MAQKVRIIVTNFGQKCGKWGQIAAWITFLPCYVKDMFNMLILCRNECPGDFYVKVTGEILLGFT